MHLYLDRSLFPHVETKWYNCNLNLMENGEPNPPGKELRDRVKRFLIPVVEECGGITEGTDEIVTAPTVIPDKQQGDLISRDALKEAINKIIDEEIKIDEKWARGLKYSLKIIDNAPTVEVSGLPKIHYDRGFIAGYEKGKNERIQGKWKLHGMIYYCSNCGHDCGESGDNFCGNCGAEMKKGGTE